MKALNSEGFGGAPVRDVNGDGSPLRVPARLVPPGLEGFGSGA